MADLTDDDIALYNKWLAQKEQSYNWTDQELEKLKEIRAEYEKISSLSKDDGDRKKYSLELTIQMKELRLEEMRYQQSVKDINRDKDAFMKEESKLLKENMTTWQIIGKLMDDATTASGRLAYTYNRQTGELERQSLVWASISKSIKEAKEWGVAGGSKAIGTHVDQMGGLENLGVFGMLMGGAISERWKEAKYGAHGQQIGQEFDAIGMGAGRGISGELGGVSRRLNVAAGVGPEALQSVTKSFAEMGVSAEKAMVKVDGFRDAISGNRSLVVAALAADRELEMANGSMARLAGTMSQQFNTAADESFKKLWAIASGARAAGMNAAQLMNQLLETTSALRMMNMNVEPMMYSQMQYGKNLGEGGAGFGNNYAQSYAAKGFGQFGGMISGMGPGLSSVIGERLGMGSGLDAWYKMQSGIAGGPGGQKDAMSIIREMANIVRETTSDRGEQAYMMSKVFGGDVAAADAALDLQEGMKPTEDQMHILNGAMKTEAQKTNSIDRNIEIIKDAISRLVVHLLEMIVNGLKMVYNMVGYAVSKIPGTGLDGSSFESAMSQNMKESALLWKSIGGEADEIAKASGSQKDMFLGNMAKGWGSWTSTSASRKAPVSAADENSQLGVTGDKWFDLPKWMDKQAEDVQKKKTYAAMAAHGLLIVDKDGNPVAKISMEAVNSNTSYGEGNQ